MKPLVVLVVEDERWRSRRYREILEVYGLEVYCAGTVEQAEAHYRKYKERIKAIIMDACVPGDEPNTLELVREIVADWKARGIAGIMVAASGIDQYRELLVEAGCTHNVPKDRAAQTVLNLLAARRN